MAELYVWWVLVFLQHSWLFAIPWMCACFALAIGWHHDRKYLIKHYTQGATRCKTYSTR